MDTFVFKSEQIFQFDGKLYIAHTAMHRNERTAWTELNSVTDESETPVERLSRVYCIAATLFDTTSNTPVRSYTRRNHLIDVLGDRLVLERY